MWTKQISEIEESGLTQTQIAKSIGATQGYISLLKSGVRGKNMSHEKHKKLTALHKRVMRKAA